MIHKGVYRPTRGPQKGRWLAWNAFQGQPPKADMKARARQERAAVEYPTGRGSLVVPMADNFLLAEDGVYLLADDGIPLRFD